MRIFHVTTSADWRAAQPSGRYTTSTRGRTLAEEGFIHASHGDQWQQVRERYYADVTEPLVLLVVETDLLSAPVVEESVHGGAESFPHVYGAIETAAVVEVMPLRSSAPNAGPLVGPTLGRAATADPDTEPGTPLVSFSRIFLDEVFAHLLVASLVMALVVLAALIGLALLPDRGGPFIGVALGLGLGVPVARTLLRRRGPQLDVEPGSPGAPRSA